MSKPVSVGFVAHQLFFELQAIEPLHLHAHNGSALRGMLYRAVAELATGDRRAPDLRFVPDPAIQRLLATLDEDNPRGKDVPRPYVIEPPILPLPVGEGRGEGELRHVLNPGETFSFGITLFGDAMEAFPVLVMGMKHAEDRGLGRTLPPSPSNSPLGVGGQGKGRFRVLRAFAQNPLTRTTQEFLAPGERIVMTPQVCISAADVARQADLDAEARSGRLRIHFHTPVTLKAQGEVLRGPHFSVLIHRLIERLTQLSVAHGGAPLPCLPAQAGTDGREARNALLRQADGIAVVEDRTRWAEVRGYSDRTRAPTNLSGFIGAADFAPANGDANAFAPFYPILRWGELAHAGSNAVKGNGLFRIQVL
jgi:hypothetical protein